VRRHATGKFKKYEDVGDEYADALEVMKGLIHPRCRRRWMLDGHATGQSRFPSCA
jgi:hypothetical protein